MAIERFCSSVGTAVTPLIPLTLLTGAVAVRGAVGSTSEVDVDDDDDVFDVSAPFIPLFIDVDVDVVELTGDIFMLLPEPFIGNLVDAATPYALLLTDVPVGAAGDIK